MVYEPSLVEAFSSRTLPTALRILEDLDTPRSLAVWLLAKSNAETDWDQVFQMPISPLNYLESHVDKFDRDYTATKLLQKIPNFLNRDLKGSALESFKAAETQCYRVNRELLSGETRFKLREQGCPDLTTVKHKMSKILGRAPSLQAVVDCGDWGPGSSYHLSRRNASPELKCEYERTITYPLACALEGVELAPWFYQDAWTLVPGNLITTVAKNAKTDRTIAIEPGINSWFQKGIGFHLRRRLARFGINLNDQTINQGAAMSALRDCLCTLDLKAASDSISMELVRAIVPKDWLYLIEVGRSQRGSFNKRNDQDKTWFEYEKVSSMGNGFTFELESTIFFAILLACEVPMYDAYVYGDDLIVPQNMSSVVIDTLDVLGFTLNDDKSFTRGLFYESCGVHAFNGVDVTPVQIKECLHGPKDIIILANKLRLYAHRRGYYHSCDRRMLPSYRVCVNWLPPAIHNRCRGPVGSALTLFVNISEAHKSRYSVKRGRFKIGYLAPVLKKETGEFSSLLQYRLFEMGTVAESLCYSSIPDHLRYIVDDPVPSLCKLQMASSQLDTALRAKKRRLNVVRTELKRFEVKETFVEQWYTLGSWE